MSSIPAENALVPPYGANFANLSTGRMSVKWPWQGWRAHRFERCVEPELPVLYRVALRLSRDPDTAADLVGQTLFKAFRGWESFDGSHLRSWLLKILKNEWGILIRSQNSSISIDHAADLETDAIRQDDVWDEVSARVDYQHILRELDNLPEEYRLAVQLCDIEELSYQEAAVVMEVPLGTVRSRLFRGREMLRKRLLPTMGVR